MKKWIALILCLCLALGCLTACSKEEAAEETAAETTETAETAETAEETEAAEEPTLLTVYTDLVEDTTECTAYMEKVAEFEEASGATVLVSHYGENLPAVLDNALNGGSTVDVFPADSLADLRTRMGDALDLSAFAADYDAPFPILLEQVQSLSADGALYGLPSELNLTAMWYNTAAFEKAGIKKTPETVKDFEKLCTALAEEGYRPIALDSAYVQLNFGIHMERALGAEALTALVSGGGWADNTAAVDAMQQILDWVAAGYYDENAPVDWPFSQLGLADRTVMLYTDTATLDIVEEMIGQDIDWGCFAYPGQSKSVTADCGTLCVNADTAAPGLAWQFISFMAQPEEESEAAAILADADSTCDPAAIVKAGPDMTAVLESLYAAAYADGAEAAAALDALY